VGNVYSTISEIRILPFSLKTVALLAILIAAPLAPLALTMIPLNKVLNSLIKLLF
jgi:hypothetical protein